jgi:tRNA (Thr-GGU) A37 N-methylase
VRVLAIEKSGSLHVRGLEAIAGTPVIDIKPALAQAGGW